jgi:hypothetical protein
MRWPRVANLIVVGIVVAACGPAAIPATITSPPPSAPAASPAASASPIVAASASPSTSPSPGAAMSPVRASARDIGERVGLAPGLGGTLFVSIPRPTGSLLALLDESGRLRPGWPVTISDSTVCGDPLPAADGSVRIVCDGTDLPVYDNDPSDVRAFAFDADGHSMTGWPVRLRPGFGRVIGDDLIYFAAQWLTDTYNVGMVSHEAWLTTIAVDGSVRAGTKVPLVESCCSERWVIAPDGIAYGSTNDYGDSVESPKSSQLIALGNAGIRSGFPIKLDGLASPPAFDAAGRLHVTVSEVSDRTAHTIVLDTNGQATAGGSDDLGFMATDECTGIEGSCETPTAPLVGDDGTTFVIGAHFNDTIVAGVTPSGEVMAGWPYRSTDGHQRAGICPPTDICEGYNLTTPALGPDQVVYLIHAPADTDIGGRIVAIGPDGRVRPGWPVELKRPGAEFWTVVVGSTGTAYGLAIEPESGDDASATVVAIAPDSTVVYTTTIIEP